MPLPADIWSFLSTLPPVISTLAAGLVVALFTFGLTRAARRADDRTGKSSRPSRRNLKAGRRHLSRLATQRRRVDGPPRWSVEYNVSLAAYEVTQHGPGDVHDLKLDFFDTRTRNQTILMPTVEVRHLPSGLPVTMRLGASSRTRHLGLIFRWDDSFGVDQIDRIRLGDATVR